MRTSLFTLVLSVSSALLAAGCFQELDSRAAKVTNEAKPIPEGFHTIDLETPAIGVVSETTGMPVETDDPCESTEFLALAILEKNCANCHGGGPGENLGQPAFTYVLNVDKMLKATSASVTDPATNQPARFLVPGNPEQSRVYVRMFHKEMPPKDIVGLKAIENRPTISDISVIYHWIAECIHAEGG